MGSKTTRELGLSVDLHEGTGPIMAMCSCGDVLEVYKSDKTFRVRTPDAFDPEVINPDAPWLASLSDDVGSSNPIVARVLLQAQDILNVAAFGGEVDTEAVLTQLHKCKESLIACERVAKRVK